MLSLNLFDEQMEVRMSDLGAYRKGSEQTLSILSLKSLLVYAKTKDCKNKMNNKNYHQTHIPCKEIQIFGRYWLDNVTNHSPNLVVGIL